MKTKSRRFLINISLFLISIAISVLLMEAALRIMGFPPMYVSPERDRFWKYDPQLGWAHQPGQEGMFETQQFRTTVRINQKGLRDRERFYERSNDTGRILVLGDSFAWGYGVEETQRFSQLLETSLGVEVINAGVSGYSTDQELLWFRSEGIKYDADLVILVFSGNDIGDNERQLVNTIYYKPRFVLKKGKLILTGNPVPRTSLQGKFVYALSQRSALAYFLVQRYFDLLSYYRNLKVDSDNASPTVSDKSPAGDPFELTIALLNEMRRLAESKGAKFMIVANDSWWNIQSKETYEDFIDRLQEAKFFVLDVDSMPGYEPEDMLIPNDGHWNETGHVFVAEQVRNFIKKNHLLDPQPDQEKPFTPLGVDNDR